MGKDPRKSVRLNIGWNNLGVDHTWNSYCHMLHIYGNPDKQLNANTEYQVCPISDLFSFYFPNYMVAP